MDLTKPFKIMRQAVKNVADQVKKAEKDVEQMDKLHRYKKQLEQAKAQYNLDIMDQREYLYLGTRAVDPNVNQKQLPSKYANNVYNICFEFIETKVDTTIPQPSVRSKRPEFTEQANMIEDSIASDLPELGIEEINDYNERITAIQGFSIIEVAWNPNYKHRLYRGEIELICRHPKQLIPQPGVYKLQKMDYFFILTSVTKEYVKQKFGIDVSNEEEQYPEVTSLYDTIHGRTNELSEKVTLITRWYRDEDGDIGKFSWVNDHVVEDLPKFFYRRLERCAECGEVRDKTLDYCAVCGSKRFKTTIEKEETLLEPVKIGSIDPLTGENEILPAGKKVPYFCPTRYPFVIRKNVPKNFAFEGQSDIDIIRDQQDSIKKVVTKMEEKLVKGGSIITVPDDLNVDITDQTYQIIRMNAAQKNIFDVKDLYADITKDLAFIEQQYEVAQSMLGITDAYQGKEDPTAKSGIAKQIQVAQASGRLQSVIANKFAAYKELFEIMFEFKLAFYDEVRPYVAKDADGNDMFQVFDKYKFLVRDATGELYYNTDFIFSADSGQGLPKDKIFIFNQAKEMLSAGAIDLPQFWMIMESINFPQAKQIRKQLEEQRQQAMLQQQTQQMQQPKPTFNQQFSQLDPQTQDMFNQLPPEAQAEIMRSVGG